MERFIRGARARVHRIHGLGGKRATLLVALAIAAALVVIPASFENAGDPDTAVATWAYANGNSGPVNVTVSGTWDWGPSAKGNDAQSCWNGNNPENPVAGFNDVNGHWAVGIAVSWNNTQAGDTPVTLTGKDINGNPVTLHLPQEMGPPNGASFTTPPYSLPNSYINPNYCVGTTAANPYPAGNYSATEQYDSLSDFLADTNGGQICVNAYDVHQPTSDEENTAKNGDNTLHNNHYDLTPGIDCVLATSTTSVNTALSATTVTVGTAVHDTATLGGATSTAGGTVKYTVYPTLNDCQSKTNGTDEGTVTVTNAVVPQSNSFTPTATGQYAWQAVYSGDSANNGSSSDCSTEVLTVNVSTPAVTTHLSKPNASVGDSVTDTATLNGATANATGTISFYVYSPSAGQTAQTMCGNAGTKGTGGALLGTAPVSGNKTYGPSPAFQPSTAGTYAFQAVYSGDASNGPVASDCSMELLVVAPNGPGITTTLSSTSIALGASVTDSAKLTGATAGAGGTVSFFVYSPTAANTAVAICQSHSANPGTGATALGSAAVSGNGTYGPSNSFKATTAGVYAFQAVYSGDVNNNSIASDCSAEELTVNPSLTTSLSGTTVNAGTAVTDSSTLNTGNAATGTISYFVFGPEATAAAAANDCSTANPAGHGGTALGTVNVTGSGKQTSSNSFTPNATGMYAFQAVYSGDATNPAASSDCSSEILTVGNPPSGDLQISINPPTATNTVGSAHTFTITVNENTGGGFQAFSGQHPTITLTNANGANGTIANNNCATTGTNGAGQCTVDVNSSSAGQVTVQAAVTATVNGTSLTRTTGDSLSGDSASAVKTFQDLEIAISPQTVSNPVTTPHTFTVTVKKDSGDGKGFQPASGQQVTITLTNANNANGSIVPGPTNTCASTAADGTCSFQVNSTTTGQVTVQASTSLTINGVALTRTTGDADPNDSPSAVKTFQDLEIGITPPTATNEVGNAHTFTVTVKKDSGDGKGFQPLQGQAVTINLTNANNAVGSIVAGTNTCASTAADGTCSFQVNSSTAGQVTVQASTSLTINGVALTRTTGDADPNDTASAVKTFVDAKITITPPNPVNAVGNAETFTVTVFTDNGSGAGFQPFTGATVLPTLTSSNGAAVQAQNGTCFTGKTDPSGTCSIIVNSSTAGKVDVHATTTVTVGGVSLTRATGDSKSGDSADDTKTYVDAQILISPLTFTNPVNSPHTFTVTVNQNLGNGSFVPLNGATVTPSVTNAGGATGQITGGTCTTGKTGDGGQTAGTCTVIVNSTTAGTVTVHVTTTVTPGGAAQSITRATGDTLSGDTGDALKTFVKADAAIAISPPASTNEVGSAHTFTVTTSESVNGGAMTPTSGITVTPSITSGNGASGQITGGTCLTGATGAGGQSTGTCTVVVNSATAGTVTISASASFSISVAGTTLTFNRSTGDSVSSDSSNAVKTFVDSFITISPASANNPTGATHVLTINVFDNAGDGKGYVAAPNGTAVTVKILSGPGSFVSGSSCTTTNGACTVSTTSGNGGTDTYQASTTLTVNGVTMTRVTGTPAPGQQNSANAVKNWIPPSGGGGTPSITITKNPKGQQVTSGGTATFTIVVTNNGTVDLTNVTVTDALAPSCNKTIGTLAAGQSAPSYTCTMPNVTANVTNEADVVGTAPSGGTVSAKDTAPVIVTAPQTPPATPAVVKKTPPKKATPKKVSKPKIRITKGPKLQTLTTQIVTTASSTKSTYGTAHFTIKVTNTGNVKLSDVTVTDALSPDCSRTGSRNLGTLAPGASNTYTCAQTNVKRNYVNVAIASGKPPTGPRVTARDQAAVKVKFKTTSTKPAKFTG